MNSQPVAPAIPGYDYGTAKSAVSPVTDEELRHLEQTVGWTAEDAAVLARHADLFRAKSEAIVGRWRGIIASQPQLARSFFKPDGTPDEEYKTRGGRRLVQWVVDVPVRPHDRDWLNYQHEIGLRHTPAKKNQADGAHTPPVVLYRYLLGFVPIVLPIREYFREAIQDESELNRIEAAWTKAVLLHVTLWSRAYVEEGLW
jgi:Protoglobin